MYSNKKRFCKRGHDTQITGRYKDRSCKICRKIQTIEWNKKYPEYEKTRHRLDNMTEEQRKKRRATSLKFHEKRMNDPILRMKKNTKRRISRYEKNYGG